MSVTAPQLNWNGKATKVVIQGNLKRSGYPKYEHDTDSLKFAFDDVAEYTSIEGYVAELAIDEHGSILARAGCDEIAFVCHAEEIPQITKWLNKVHKEYTSLKNEVKNKVTKKTAKKARHAKS